MKALALIFWFSGLSVALYALHFNSVPSAIAAIAGIASATIAALITLNTTEPKP